MSVNELFKAGKLQQALDAQVQEVKANPADQGKRLFLFELLAFAGDLDRARRQIEALTYTEPELVAARLNYKNLLDSEEARRKLFRDGVPPKFFGEAPEHVHWRLEAVNRLLEGRSQEARQCLEKADEATPAIKGRLNDRPFTSLRDGDDVLASVLEVLAQGLYYWVPLEQVETLTLNAPKYPRDLLWISARLELADSGGNVFLPSLYPGSHEHPDEAIKLGRSTDWKEIPDGPVQGVGVHTFLADDEASGLLEWRKLERELSR
jgi:type VI secretion system protein ImpE